jgi:hypothetical protein
VIGIILFGILAALGLLGWRMRKAEAFMPAGAPRGDVSTRALEALALWALGMTTLVMLAFSPSSGDVLGRLGELGRAYAAANVAVFVVAAGLVCWGVWYAYQGLYRAAVALLLAALIGHLGWSETGAYPGKFVFSESWIMAHVPYTITIDGMRGGEVWVNGVNLGPSPVHTTSADFTARVPYWDKPPADFATDTGEYVSNYLPSGAYPDPYPRWAKIELPAEPRWDRAPLPETDDKTPRHFYYVRARLAGEWGLATGSGGSGGGGGMLTSQMYDSLEMRFPGRDARLINLMNQARLADYRVTPAWFEAIETYNEQGWIAVRTAMADEPGFTQVMDDWANWKYGVQKVQTTDEAWRMLERIEAEADAQEQYLTPSPAGRVVELIADKIDMERLVRRAERLVAAGGSYGYFDWTLGGQLQFGYSKRPVYLGGGGVSSTNVGWQNADEFPFGGFAVAHAVWVQWQHGKNRELVQQRIVPALIAWRTNPDHSFSFPTDLITLFGGPGADHYLLLQDWRSNDTHAAGHFAFVPGNVNQWLYALANLDDDAGRQFRIEHRTEIAALAEQFSAARSGYELGQRMDFVFKDPRIAKYFWPRFAQLSRESSRHWDGLRRQWEYLRRMGAAATAEMFVEAFRQTTLTPMDWSQASTELGGVQEPLRGKVIAALLAEMQKDPEHVKTLLEQYSSPVGKTQMDRFAADLQALVLERPLRNVQSSFQRIEQSAGTLTDKQRQGIRLWLANEPAAAPAIPMFATAQEAALRALAPAGIQGRPTPENRGLLERLLVDDDQQVKQEAASAAQALHDLSATPAKTFAAVPQ